MKVLDDIYCGITYDIPTEKEYRKALKASKGWKSYRFDYRGNSNREEYEQVHYKEDSVSEYDEEEHNLLEEVQRKEYDVDTGM